jgi:uncharacterized Zn finger protein (UPF0148 family)
METRRCPRCGWRLMETDRYGDIACWFCGWRGYSGSPLPWVANMTGSLEPKEDERDPEEQADASGPLEGFEDALRVPLAAGRYPGGRRRP